MEFTGGVVVGLCGFALVFEVAEGDGITISGNFRYPLLVAGVPAYTFVSGASVFSFLGVAVILGTGYKAKIGLSIVIHQLSFMPAFLIYFSRQGEKPHQNIASGFCR